MVYITKVQLFFLIMLFEIGSTTLFALGIKAKQDAWIVVLIASFIGSGLVWVFTQFPKFYPNKNFSDILDSTIGRKLAIPLLFIYSAYFLSGASFNFYEFSELIKVTALPLTPRIIILYLFIIVTVYILILGFEVLARTAEILLPVFIIFLIFIYIITMFSGHFNIRALLPVLGNGLKPILGKTLVEVVVFPFGELIVFIMFWHFVKKQEQIRKVSLFAIALSTFFIIFSLIVLISMLGPELTANSAIPLLHVLLAINIADIITNIDLLAILVIFIGGFFKTGLHFYGAVLSVTWIFRIKDSKWVIVVLGALFPIYNIFRFDSMIYHRWLGSEIHWFVIVMINLMTVLLLIVIFLKQKSETSEQRRERDVNP